ncbi:hypothetical protein CEXT_92201 [Caerostris extrusa]|uniref:Uncharacterized protein n=1 Tax=Caerostris extrusa TaxID=172846 RepID=A0AAV4UH58_CAEEX|nr:hypothetical protein CEXT_92201 [Caerostris extrusa]
MIPFDLPRRICVSCFRMLRGHDYLQQHLNKIGQTTSASCHLCGEDFMNGGHHLICTKLKDAYALKMLLILVFRTYIGQQDSV